MEREREREHGSKHGRPCAPFAYGVITSKVRDSFKKREQIPALFLLSLTLDPKELRRQSW